MKQGREKELADIQTKQRKTENIELQTYIQTDIYIHRQTDVQRDKANIMTTITIKTDITTENTYRNTDRHTDMSKHMK